MKASKDFNTKVTEIISLSVAKAFNDGSSLAFQMVKDWIEEGCESKVLSEKIDQILSSLNSKDLRVMT